MNATDAHREKSIAGVIFGTAVGDSLGLPREGMSRRRGRKMFGEQGLGHGFVFGRGMVSDDTEHTCIVGQALLTSPRDVERFARSLAWGLRFWLLGLPVGLGKATLRAVLKLWLGFPPERSGVYSAGNGPAMRAAILGVCLDDIDQLKAYVRASTRLTHTDPRAERGALLVALAASLGARLGPERTTANQILPELKSAMHDSDAELEQFLAIMEDHLGRGDTPDQFANALGQTRGVSGYIYHTVPVALYCWLRWPGDVRRTVESAINLGGDTDTTGAIAGALAGATAGAGAIPVDWLNGLMEWPRSVAWMRRLSEQLMKCIEQVGDPKNPGRVSLFWPGLIPRNLFFLVLVLVHVLRRLLPPY